MRLKKSIILYLSIIILVPGCSKDDEVKIDPKFFTSDIDLFWSTFDTINSDFSESLFQEQYIDKGSAGLKDYARMKDLASSLEWRLKQKAYLDYYQAIRSNTFDYEEQIKKSKVGIKRLQEIYSGTIIYDVYFFIGALTAGGKTSDNGLLIAVEMFSSIENISLSALDYVYQRAIKTKDFIPNVIIHELVHLQQHPICKNIEYITNLERAILEGMADYISELILPDEPFMNIHIHQYADTIEENIWLDFKEDMNKKSSSTDWFYSDNSNNTLGYERDMGYYIGYKILESYSQKFDSEKELIVSMLNSTDYYEIFEDSDYELIFK